MYAMQLFPKTKQVGAILAGLLLLLATPGCRKDHPTCNCYDEKLYQQRKDSFCTTDCPGVTGCDGKFYCNECEANRNGIRVK